MKRALLSFLMPLALVACATSNVTTDSAPTVVDQQRVAAIERAAARAGVRIIWMRYPDKAARAPGT